MTRSTGMTRSSAQSYQDSDQNALQLAEDADDTLFRTVLADPQHVLHHLVPSRTLQSYKLPPRQHDCSLTVRLSRAFSTMMCYINRSST